MIAASCPPPGIYHEVEFAEYLRWDAISNSSLHAAKKSMLHYRHQQPLDETPSLRLGSLCHAGKFEPLQLMKQYAVVPEDEFANQVRRKDGSEYTSPKGSSAFKELVATFKEKNAGKIFVSDGEFSSMLGIVKALSQHERASEYLAVIEDTTVEVAIVWVDEDTGLKCKGRVDCLKKKTRMASDLKTARDVTRFQNVIADRSYHRQGAFYIDGLKEQTGEDYSFTITAVETVFPFGVRAAPLSEDAIEAGRDEYKSLLKAIAAARESDVWPGFESPNEWTLPAWAVPTDDDFELTIGGESVRL